MTRKALWGAALALALAAPASAETYFGFHIGIGNAPPPPTVVFRHEPEVVFVRTAGVYVVDSPYDCDMFRYGAYYYISDNGYWYRARSYRGPFRVIDVRYVPRPVFHVPARHWKRHWRNNHVAHWDHDRGYRSYRSDRGDRADRGEHGRHKKGRGHGDH